jgi:hypothetical protein
MATFDSIFPTFLSDCAQLNQMLLSVAFALFIVGVIMTVFHRFSHRVLFHLLIRLLVLTSLLVYLPVWGNDIQQILQNSIISGLGVDPSQTYQRFFHLLVINRDPTTMSSWWSVLSRLPSISADLLITAVLWVVGWVATVMMFWAYIIQTVILNIGYALSPLLIGFMAIPALKHLGSRYLLNLAGVLLWPLGWAVAALVTEGMLDFLSNPASDYLSPVAGQPGLQGTLGAATVGFWIIFSTIAAPLIIQKVIVSGALATTGLLSGAASAGIQTATSAISAATTATPLGPVAAVAAGGAAGTASMFSTSAGVGNAGSVVSGLVGLGTSKSDPSGDKAVRQLLTQLLQHLGQLPPIAPVNSLPPKL